MIFSINGFSPFSNIITVNHNNPLFFVSQIKLVVLGKKTKQKTLYFFGSKMQEQGASSFPANSLPSSSERSSSSALQLEIKDGMESDEEIRRVPEMGVEGVGPSSTSGRGEGGSDRVLATTEGTHQRKRGRSPADKENKRLKRLLRNRVSAQQARERKKAYLSELEVKVKDLEKKNSELEERLSTLQNENQMLRHILKNTTASRRE